MLNLIQADQIVEGLHGIFLRLLPGRRILRFLRAEETEKTHTPAITDLKSRAASIQGILHFYDDLAAGLRDLEGKTAALKQADEKVRRIQMDLAAKKERQLLLADRLKELASAGDMAVSVTEGRLKGYMTRKADLEYVMDGLQTAARLAGEETALKDSLRLAQSDELMISERYLALNKAFIQGQAGILARELREQLEKNTEAVCPVCGARRTAADVRRFAPWHTDIPTREAVDRAFTDLENARRISKGAEDAHRAKAGELSIQRQLLLEKAQSLIPVADWDSLTSGTGLTEAAAACEEQIAEAAAAHRQAVADRAEKEKAGKDKTKTDLEIAAAEKELTDQVRIQNDARTAVTAADTNAANWRSLLRGYPPTGEEALQQIRSLQAQAGQLQQQIDEAKKKLSDTQNDLAQNTGSLKAAYAEKEIRGKNREDAAGTYAARLERWFPAGPDAYREALRPQGTLLDQEGLEQWMAASQTQADEYVQHRRNLDVMIGQLTASTKDMQRVDIDAISAQISEVEKSLEELRDRQTELASNMNTDRKVRQEIAAIRHTRAGYRKAAEKLGPLAETADGKYAFSRYVLTGFFHRIVEQANIHLETMTDGEYCLVPKETGDGRSNLGLELKVLNTITNLERDTASLSGGQLFEASLSLALGLSDIVQMQSTSGIRIDSMFIDEGFGSLDGARLDKAIAVLQHLSAGRRQIGIISHVARLDECLPKKIHVIAGEHGSTVQIETDTVCADSSVPE